LAAARESELPANVLNITPHNREKVWNSTWTADNAYVFVPLVANEYYALMVELIRSGDLSYVGMCNLRNSEGLFRLDVWRDMIVVQKLVWPEDCNEIDPVDGDCDQETVDQFRAVLSKKQIEFDADKYRSGVKEQVIAMTEAITGGAIAPKVSKSSKPKPGASLADALAALEAS
jgi:non-homologous end joining protein Ku